LSVKWTGYAHFAGDVNPHIGDRHASHESILACPALRDNVASTLVGRVRTGGQGAPGNLIAMAPVLISFDIDGTLVDGDPPGPIEIVVVRQAMEQGFIVGSASDRTVREQRSLWTRHALEPSFVGHKHVLEQLRARFDASQFVHVGDTEVDAHYARLAGFDFYYAWEFPSLLSFGGGRPSAVRQG
jgi:hypothetical protein